MKKTIYMLVAVILMMNTSIVEAADPPTTVTKTYQLAQGEKFVEFVLEGYDGSFTSSLTLPDGHIVEMKKATKINDPIKPYWVNSYSINSAAKGKYTFKINAPKQAYYNLRVNVPMFSDINNHWAQESINAFVEKGIIAGLGNGKFAPNEPITGEALVKMTVLALTQDQPNGKRIWKKEFRWKVINEDISKVMGYQEYSFSGNSTEHWSKPYLLAAGDLGIASNWSNEDLKKTFNRKDIALLLSNIMNLVKVNITNPISFNDTIKLSDNYKKAIELVSNYSVFAGYPDGSFKPENQVTRAEAVMVVSRLIGFLE
ncbi:hypothetical protein BK120_23235 [Paenibacillus sp. FSL A5-0031]|uniref:S-layer homology domain-containing protein n=1 Tax=Paenibacillus sp. FSL A5-0031 TaxID=1920420 RepID=UPI00096F6E2A|nr:S-layer homology domain-containing protein [Paenibacillus sp. FSL A5-0031]OME78656.1 hypothetical protein BK120_23235 [Paenibacillus sp. FSL A5-0031]